MSSFLKSVWDVVGSEMTGLLGTEQDEQNRQDKVTNLLIDRPFEFGKSIGLYGDKIQAPEVIDTTNVNNSVKDNAIASMRDQFSNMQQDSEVFRKNMPSSLFEIGEFGIDLAMNPIKYGKEAIGLGSGFATMPFEDIDNADNEAMAQSVIDSTIEFFGTEGAVRKAALENPADVLFIMMGGVAGVKKLQALKPETKERMLSTIKKVGATPVGLSMKDVSTKEYAKVDDAGFYLKSEQVVLDEFPSSIPNEQMRGWFQKRQVSNQELEDIGIFDLIDKTPDKDKITKEGLLQHIDDNRITTTGQSLKFDPDAEEKQPDDVVIMNAEDNYRRDFEPSWDAKGTYEVDFADGTTERARWTIADEDADYLYDRGKEIFSENMGNQYRGGIEGQENAIYPFNLGSSLGNYKDSDNIAFIKHLHDSYPERYPMTKALEIDQAMVVKDFLGNEIRTLDTNMDKIAMIKADIADRQRQGIEDWDQKLMYAIDDEPDLEQLMLTLDGMDDLVEGVSNKTLYADIENYADSLGEKEYLDNPIFDIEVPMPDGNGSYLVTGNGMNGYRIFDVFGNDVESSGHNYYDDIPAVQLAIEEHSVDSGVRGFGGEPDTKTRWEEYTQFDGSGEKGGGTNYSEELILIDGNKFTNTHNPDYPGVGTHIRKTHRAEYLDGNDSDPENLYYLEELQSDFHQQNRQYGYTEEERVAKYNAQRDVVNLSSKTESAITTLDEKRRHHNSTHQLQLRFNDEDFLAENRDLYDQIDNRLLFEALRADTVSWNNLQMKGEDVVDYDVDGQDGGENVFKKYTKDEMAELQKTVDAVEEGWPRSTINPESPNFQGFDMQVLSTLKKWFMSNTNSETRTLNAIENHNVQAPAPFKGKRWINTGLKYAIKQAILDGKDTVVWTPAYMQKNIWGAGTDHRGVPGNKNLYDTLYDKDIPNNAKKFSKKYGTGDEVQVIDVNMDNQRVQHLGIRITPLMIENMRKEFPELNTKGEGKMENGGYSDEYMKSKKVGLPQELYSGILPIGGLLAAQQEQQQEGLLL